MKLFGTDGIRGVANRDPMTSETVLRVGRALAFVAKNFPGRSSILIGKDTRLSGYMIETALASGICSMGVDVLLAGPIPTAGVAWLTRQKQASRGVAVTASHNPYRDNGIKIFDPDGSKISNEEERQITKLVDRDHLDLLRPIEEEIGKATRVDDAGDRIIDFLVGTFPMSLHLKGLTLAVDCANGASYKIAPRVFERLGAKVTTLGASPNGTNINEDCGSQHPEGLQHTVLRIRADAGIALDGDGDRCVMVDEAGGILDGDRLLSVSAVNRLHQNLLAGKTVVVTDMSNTAFVRFLERQGIQVKKVSVGDQNIALALREGGYSLGGEQSGHLLFPEFSSTVDGVLTALQILRAMKEEGEKLSLLSGSWKRWPQLLKNIPVSEKPPLEGFPDLAKQIKICQARLGNHGRVVVRYSGTEMLLRIMVEAEEESVIQPMVNELEKSFFPLYRGRAEA